ncbi:MAG: hemerythrin domain-containing protein [Desulfobacteraceae bacterium]|nr:hemerythrin domain-containing protein [Desulfobacteraceae bacterium]
MELYWVSEFEIGNEYVDLQHRYFLDLINRIGKNFRETNDGDYKRKLIIELHKYADFHFASEENIAISCGLPGVESHHQLHLQLLEELNQYAENLDKGLKTINEFLEFITDWFLVHTQHEDRKFFKAK